MFDENNNVQGTPENANYAGGGSENSSSTGSVNSTTNTDTTATGTTQQTTGYTQSNTGYTQSGYNTNTTGSANQYGSNNTTQQNNNYGSNSYSNYNYGQTANTNSYGSYSYTNNNQTGSTQNPYSGSTYQGQNTNNQSFSNQLRQNAGQNTTGQGYGTYNYSYNNAAAGGSNIEPPKKKKKTALTVAGIAAVAAIFLGGLGVGAYGLYRSNNTGSSDVAAVESSSDTSTEAESTDESTESATVNKTTTSSSTVVTDVTEVVAETMPSIVSINNNYTESATYFGQTYSEEATASGSGIIVGQSDTELLIATNYHVIEGADSLEVQFVDDSTAEAAVKGTDSDMDLAVIAVQLSDITSDTLSAIKVATLGDSDALTVGEPAIAIGNALGYGQSVTTGVISAVNRTIELDDTTTGTFIQTDAAINPGNSGGALININGEVIGINSNKIGGTTIEGMGYAIPISVAQPIIEELMNEETKIKVDESEKGYIGISGVSVTSEVSEVYGLPSGVYVAQVTSGGGAEAAGIQEGDIITKFEGEEITSMDDLQKKLEYYAVGTTVSVTVMRAGSNGYEEQEYQVTLGAAATTTDENGTDGETYDGEPQQGSSDEMPSGQNGFGGSQQYSFPFGY